MSWFKEDWGISEAAAGSNIAISILFQKTPSIGKLPQAQCNPTS